MKFPHLPTVVLILVIVLAMTVVLVQLTIREAYLEVKPFNRVPQFLQAQ